MTLEKPAGTASKLGTYDLLKEQPGIGVGSTWIARSTGDGGESPALFSVIRVHKHLTKKPETAPAVVADTEPARGFQHPNLAGLVEAATDNGELYIVSEHHHGETLAALVAAAGASGLPQPVVIRIALDVLAGLAAAHAHTPHLAHGELGPHQIVVGDDGVSRVTGLVSARALSRVTPPIGAKNHDRLAYAAPERVKTLSATTPSGAEPQADVFSVGVVLWEGLSRQRLFTSKIEAAIIQKVLTAPIAALGTVAGVTVAPALAEAVGRALERDPAKRTQTAGELAAALEALGADAVATPAQVAAEVERLAGKAITTRKNEVRNELARRANKGSTIPPPAIAKPGAPAPRKTTLLGIPAVKAGPASEGSVKVPPAAAVPVIAAMPVIPVEPKPFRAPAESLDLEDIEVAASHAPPPRPPPTASKRVTLLMGAVNMPGAASPPDEPAAKPAPAKPIVSAPAALKPAHALLDQGTGGTAGTGGTGGTAGTGKTANTPASDGPSPRSKQGVAVEKVGPGSTLGRYEILMPVARGGMASVWAARLPGSRGFQKIFAIKTMLPDVSDDPEFESMFLDEGRVAARIRHPNVVEIIDLGEQEDVLYLVMEWVEGENLGALVKASRALGGVPLPIILRIASQVCAGLHAAHDLRDDDGNLLDLVHRDISPANVLLSASGFVKIVDFGIAKSKGRLHVTRVGGMVKGKTPYLSPEQLGQQPLDRRSDIFSFGVLLYVLATGLHPFRGETDSKTIENIALREPVPLRAIVATTPPEFEAVVLKALSKEPRDRFNTAGEMQRALDQVASILGFTTTEEDVAAFSRKALGETFTKRAQDLRAALERAEGRTPAAIEAANERASAIPPEPAATAAGTVIMPAVAEAGAAPAALAVPSPKPPVAAAPASKLIPAAKREPISAGFAKPKLADVVTLPEIGDLDPAASGSALKALPPPPPLDPPLPAAPAAPSAEESAPAIAPVATVVLDVSAEPEAPAAEAGAIPAMLFEMPPAPEPEPASGDRTSRPVTRSDPGPTPTMETVRPPPRRKPVAMIAVGAVMGVCAIVGVVALLGGTTKATPAKLATTAAAAVTATATAAAPTATAPLAAVTAPTPTATAEPTATQAPTADPPAPDPTTAPYVAPVGVGPRGKGLGKGTLPVKPPPGGKPPRTTKKPYNPGTL